MYIYSLIVNIMNFLFFFFFSFFEIIIALSLGDSHKKFHCAHTHGACMTFKKEPVLLALCNINANPKLMLTD